MNAGQHFRVWVYGSPAAVAEAISRSVAADLAHHHIDASVVREDPGPGSPVLRVEVDGEPGRTDLVVSGDAARAGESAATVLRHLSATGWTPPLDDYSDDDEAVVAERLQSFGYL